MKYLTSGLIANKWKISERQVRTYCENGRIPGCFIEGKTWYIPENSNKPTRQKRNNLPKKLIDILREEKNIKLSGGIYHKLQIEMTYNSNHIEGSKLTEDQTRMIFETKTIGATNGATRIDDIIETFNHFKCIDYVIDIADKKLNEQIIKKMHLLLKQNTSDAMQEWFNVGDYKMMPNEVVGKETSSPETTKKEILNLLDRYNSKVKHSFEEIIEFHYKFECIHPFQDGNGRVGRLIMLKECLKNNIVPVLIKDEFKDFYYRGLNEFKYEKGYLIDTCLHGQDIFKKYLDYFKIKY